MKASIRKIDLLCDVDEQIPEEFNTDPKRLKQIILNLVGNAMKFTVKGYVKIKANFIKIENSEAIKIQIIDTGFGI